MIQIRKNIFETNSSSTHSLVISNDGELNIPDSLTIQAGQFGWENTLYTSAEDKASYIYTLLLDFDEQDCIDQMVNWLSEEGINVDVIPVYNNYLFYVDHSNDAWDFINYVTTDKDHLLQFLFSPDSFILTGNDNDDIDTSEEAENKCKNKNVTIFYKGN